MKYKGYKIFKRTYYWAAIDNKNVICFAERTKAEIKTSITNYIKSKS